MERHGAPSWNQWSHFSIVGTCRNNGTIYVLRASFLPLHVRPFGPLLSKLLAPPSPLVARCFLPKRDLRAILGGVEPPSLGHQLAVLRQVALKAGWTDGPRLHLCSSCFSGLVAQVAWPAVVWTKHARTRDGPE